MGQVHTAVILAAGRGSRLQGRGILQPKGFLRLGALPIVEESVLKLLASGIDRIWIVTGHQADFYQQLAELYPQIRLKHNADFADSGSMFSLFQLRDELTTDFILLESDLIYQQRALTEVLQFPAENCLLMSGRTQSQDEVWVQAPAGYLQALSKDPMQLSSLDGELVGITLLSAPLYQAMCSYAEQCFRQSRHLEYEIALAAAANQMEVPCLKLNDLVWSEIDTEEHLARARQLIYPKIAAEIQQLTGLRGGA